jgi:hypothetical protein
MLELAALPLPTPVLLLRRTTVLLRISSTPTQEIARSQKLILGCGLERCAPEARLAISPTRFW